ncbi:nitronate monooxygenase [Candidatus Bipolaricaulota bacterium]|nr:nitronate monooxygenase [Candidatus Bipolaricaulota bacterium]
MANRICEMLGVKYPIFSGGMAHVARAPLVAAVSEAGGLGIIGAGGMSPEDLEREIAEVRRLTDKPFGVNLMLMDPNVPEQVEVVVRERVALVTTGAGSPAKYMDKLKSAGIKVFPVIPAVNLAVRVEKYGADGVIAEGMESGGHIGTITTMALVPQVGTRFVASEEAPVHPNYKQAILKAKDRDTIVTGRTLGRPVRCLVNKLTKTLARYEAEGRDPEEFESLAVGGLRRAVYDGDLETGSLMAGQIAGLIREIKPVREIIEDMVKEARGILSRGLDF